MDHPFDWELGYENVPGGRSKATNTATGGNLGTLGRDSTRMRSHTTALRDRQPGATDDKNRAMDTQAPITMGEDDDEQTGNYRYIREHPL